MNAFRGADLQAVQELVDRVALISGKRTVLRGVRVDGCTPAVERPGEGTAEGPHGAPDAESASGSFQVLYLWSAATPRV